MRSLISSVVICGSLFFSFSAVAQICPESVERTQAEEYFINHADGTVTDKRTGLMWMHCSLGQTLTSEICIGNAVTYTWIEALLQAQKSNEHKDLNYYDWRLPSVVELASILELGCYSPSINMMIFPNTRSNFYWSSSPNPRYNQNAWYIHFDMGYESSTRKTEKGFVRLVRGGQ